MPSSACWLAERNYIQINARRAFQNLANSDIVELSKRQVNATPANETCHFLSKIMIVYLLFETNTIMILITLFALQETVLFGNFYNTIISILSSYYYHHSFFGAYFLQDVE